MSRAGWVKLWRKSMESAVWSDPNLWRVYCCCLMLANHKERWVKVDGLAKPVLVKPGQFITGRFEFHKAMYPKKRKSNPSPITVWRWIKVLQALGNLIIETNNKFSLITVVNWDTYQCQELEDDQQNDQQVISRRSADDQQVITNKNVKNIKKRTRTFSSDSNEVRLAELLYSLILQNNPKAKKPNLQSWARQVDLAHRIDGRSFEDLEAVIRWCQQDQFWSCNILSTSKLRERFDQLWLKMIKPKVPAGSNKQSYANERDRKLLGTFQTLVGGQYNENPVSSFDDEEFFDV